MSLDHLSQLLSDSVNQAGLIIAVVSGWPGLALLARRDGSVIAASSAWGETTSITSAALRLHGWAHFVHPDDADSTNAEVAEMTGPSGRPAVGFINRYVGPDGTVYRLRWKATPYADAGTTLAIAEILP